MPRTVAVYFLPAETSAQDFAGRAAIVVDLLRASTTIATALAAGARDVIPAESPERAMELRNGIGRASTLLCGERKGEMIPGFDLGNSPRDYTPAVVGEKHLIFASSNGSAAILAASDAERLCVGALVNAGPVIRWVEAGTDDCVILCSGKLGQFAAEDAACAGHFVLALQERGFALANDGARTAALLASSIRGRWRDFVGATDHGAYLSQLGFAADFPVVCAVDSLEALPVWHENRLIRAVATAKG